MEEEEEEGTVGSLREWRPLEFTPAVSVGNAQGTELSREEWGQGEKVHHDADIQIDARVCFDIFKLTHI